MTKPAVQGIVPNGALRVPGQRSVSRRLGAGSTGGAVTQVDTRTERPSPAAQQRGWHDADVSFAKSGPDSLTLHAVRLLGFADARRVARRFQQDLHESTERLLDMEALGWVTRSEFGGTSGWSLTERGRAEGERRLALEVDTAGARTAVAAVHERFLPLNGRFQETVTRWQIRPLPGVPMAANDHTDHSWDDRVLEVLGSLGRRLRPLETELTAVLARFGGYSDRFDLALDQAVRGEARWVDGVGIDSCHAVWMQLHEDLLATLGIDRGHET